MNVFDIGVMPISGVYAMVVLEIAVHRFWGVVGLPRHVGGIFFLQDDFA